jgi:hypothetical protein
MSLPFILPIVALGVAYFISSDSDKNADKTKENFTSNSGKNLSNSSFNDSKFNDSKVNDSKVNNSKSSGNTAKTNQIYSLTGKYVDTTDFKHENMVPFYSSKTLGTSYTHSESESILDNMVGAGSQAFHKTEQAPLFNPEDNVQWAHGAPNNNSFYQSRMNTSLQKNNVKPFQTENVGPGLNKGYTAEGSGGFNSGLDARDLYLPKTVDDLRIVTNPKVVNTLDNLQGHSFSHVQNVGILGKVEKNRPERFFVQNQDRWFTTTGLEKGETLRGEILIDDTARNQQTQAYSGGPGRADSLGNYAPQNYEKAKRQDMTGEKQSVGPSTAINKGPEMVSKNQRLKSYNNYSNNRTTTFSAETFGSGFTKAIGAVIAPLMDIVNPTRRQESTQNLRIYGDASSRVPENYIINPNDKPATTIKETTLFTPPLMINNQTTNVGGYMVSEHVPPTNQRATTDINYYGDAGGSSTRWGDGIYTSAYNQHNNDMKEPMLKARTNHGNMSIYNEPEINFSISRNDADRINNRQWVPTNMPSNHVTKDMITESRRPQTYENVNLIEPDLLNAFRQNPYTHSLSSVA